MTPGQSPVVTPDFRTVDAACARGETVVVTSRRADDLLTPVAAYLKLANTSPHTFLLESVEGGAWRGRYSAIGLDPDLIWRCRDGHAAISTGEDLASKQFRPLGKAPMDALRDVIESARCELPDGAAPIGAGLFGYLGYDMVRYMERLPDAAAPEPLDLPESVLMRPRTIVVFDSLKQEIQVFCPIRTEGFTPREAYDAA